MLLGRTRGGLDDGVTPKLGVMSVNKTACAQFAESLLARISDFHGRLGT